MLLLIGSVGLMVMFFLIWFVRRDTYNTDETHLSQWNNLSSDSQMKDMSFGLKFYPNT